MERFKVFGVIMILFSSITVNGQMITTPCTSSLVSSFTPCLNFITGSSGGGSSSPSASCCSSLSNILTTGIDCTCLIVTANIPLQLPFIRTLALSLPQACNMGSLALQCKASATPLPAPGPNQLLLGPSLPPTASSSLSPRASKAIRAAKAPSVPQSQPILPEPPASSPAHSQGLAPTTINNPRIRPVLQPSPSSSSSSHLSMPPLLIPITIIMVILSSY